MPSTIFYAWQSDRDQKCSHYLIRDAANDAIKQINAEASVDESPRAELDHDRKGIPGHPHIFEAIKKKIAVCEVFIADLTNIGPYRTSDGREKKAQNANVMLELGLAMRYLPLERMILVMNTAHGGAESVPFDLQHIAKPIDYHAPDGCDKTIIKDQQKKLADAFARNLKQMLSQPFARDTTSRAVEELESQAVFDADWQNLCNSARTGYLGMKREADTLVSVSAVRPLWKQKS